MDEYFRRQKESSDLRLADNAHRILSNPPVCGKDRCAVHEGLMKCARCHKRYYCCKEHQKMDWKVHKRYCRVFEDDPALAMEERTHAPLEVKQREEEIKRSVDGMMKAIETDFYPPEDLESRFGIQKGTKDTHRDFTHVGVDFPIGNIVYLAWCSAVKRSGTFSTLQDLAAFFTDGFRHGTLPEKLRQLATPLFETCVYCRELVLRDFKGIHWDQRALLRMSGKRW